MFHSTFSAAHDDDHPDAIASRVYAYPSGSREIHLVFLRDPRLRTVETRWNDMAARIRTLVRSHGWHFFYVDLLPPAEARARPRQLIFRTADEAQGPVLDSAFEEMQISDDTIELVSLTVVLIPLAQGLHDSRRVSGYGNGVTGAKAIPRHLKRRGIVMHPDSLKVLTRRRQALALQQNCGPRALLFRNGTYLAGSMARFIADGEDLARRAGMTSGAMQLHDIPNILKLPEWRDKRIVHLSHLGARIHIFAGTEWVWPEGLSKLDVHLRDEIKTYFVYLDTDVEPHHYYTVKYLPAFYQVENTMDYITCFGCCTKLTKTVATSHHCDTQSASQCSVCQYPFANPQLKEAHERLLSRRSSPCECCEKVDFCGDGCYERHKSTNCEPTLRDALNARKAVCQDCKDNFRTDCEHRCMAKRACLTCGLLFRSDEEWKLHHCPLVGEPRFYEPTLVRTKKNGDFSSYTWKSHWAYDFETTKANKVARPALPGSDGENDSRPDVYQLRVMAWALQLIVPCANTVEHMKEHKIVNSIVDHFKIDPAAEQSQHITGERIRAVRIPSRGGSPDTVRLRGYTLEEFIYTVEHVCRRDNGTERWLPTLWAHNGSKFDVKFVYDYFANTKQMEIIAHQTPADGEKVVARRSLGRDPEKIQMVNVGSRVLSLHVHNVAYKCSQAHHACALRNLPAVFGLDPDILAKGEFPYSLLKEENWDAAYPGLPHLGLYEVNSLSRGRRKEVILWWTKEQMRRGVSPTTIRDQLTAVGMSCEDVRAWFPAGIVSAELTAPEPWIFRDELWKYLDSDVDVLARCMEAYHGKAVEIHRSIWDSLPANDARRECMVSPLNSSTSPGWAYKLYTTFLMPPDTVYCLRAGEETEMVRDGLRGGRTDKRCNYVDVSPERRRKGDRMVYYDFKSLYPSVQNCDTHGTHFPIGKPWWAKWRKEAFSPETPPGNVEQLMQLYAREPHVYLNRKMSNEELKAFMNDPDDLKTGFLRISYEVVKFVTHPTLHHIGVDPENDRTDKDPKLLFSNISNPYVPPIDPWDPKLPKTDKTKPVYGWPEIEEAIDSGEIRVTYIHDMLLFKRGTNVFADYVKVFFDIKEQADRDNNEGLRSLAKLMLNSLWGKLGQKSYPIREHIKDLARLDTLFNLFDNKRIRFVSIQRHDEQSVTVEYLPTRDITNLRNTAPHIAAFVSMWGRVVLHKKVLRKHGQRALYCDTDSAIIYLRGKDRMDHVGPGLGQLTDELAKFIGGRGYNARMYPNLYIKELVPLAPKTYAFAVCHDEPFLLEYKEVCKGFEPSYDNSQSIHFLNFKDLVFSQHDLKSVISRKRPLTATEENHAQITELTGSYRMAMISSVNRPLPHQTKMRKTLTGTYNKGRNHAKDARLVVPFGGDQEAERRATTFLDFEDSEEEYGL